MLKLLCPEDPKIAPDKPVEGANVREREEVEEEEEDEEVEEEEVDWTSFSVKWKRRRYGSCYVEVSSDFFG